MYLFVFIIYLFIYLFAYLLFLFFFLFFSYLNNDECIPYCYSYFVQYIEQKLNEKWQDSAIRLFTFCFILFQLLPGVKVVIANPETRGQCADSHLGEVRSFV